jgi:type VI secretion system secreted protein VgrG
VLLNDQSGEPAAFTEYAIEREDGSIEHGITNDRGETHLVSATSSPEKVRVYAAINH